MKKRTFNRLQINKHTVASLNALRGGAKQQKKAVANAVLADTVYYNCTPPESENCSNGCYTNGCPDITHLKAEMEFGNEQY